MSRVAAGCRVSACGSAWPGCDPTTVGGLRSSCRRLAINPDGKRIRRRNARVLTDAHPDLWAWLDRRRRPDWPTFAAATRGR